MYKLFIIRDTGKISSTTFTCRNTAIRTGKQWLNKRTGVVDYKACYIFQSQFDSMWVMVDDSSNTLDRKEFKEDLSLPKELL